MTIDVEGPAQDPVPEAQFRNPKRPWIVRLGKKLRFAVNRVLVGQSLVGDDRVLDKAAFPWLGELERAVPAIRAEVDRLLEHSNAIPPMNEMSPDHGRIAGAGGW
jgi:beta-hydroxylase